MMMRSYRVRWTQDGKEHVSAVAYDERCAQERMTELEAQAGVTDVRSFRVNPGEWEPCEKH